MSPNKVLGITNKFKTKNNDSSPVSHNTGGGTKASEDLLTTTTGNQQHPEPLAGFSSHDIEWQWTSPTATVPNVKKRTVKTTPLQVMKKQCKSVSPVNNFPRRRKLIKCEGTEVSTVGPPDLLKCGFIDDSTKMIELQTELGINNKCSSEDLMNAGNNASFCALLDDEDSIDDCLIRCSQYVEENLSQNPGKELFSSNQITTPRRSPRVKSATPKSRNTQIKQSRTIFPSSASSNSKTVKKSVPIVATKLCRPTEMQPPSITTSKVAKGGLYNSSISIPNQLNIHSVQSMDVHISAKENVAHMTKKKLTTNDVAKYESGNDSFEDTLMHFYEENDELLSQTLNLKLPGKLENKIKSSSNIHPLNISEHRSVQAPQDSVITIPSNNITSQESNTCSSLRISQMSLRSSQVPLRNTRPLNCGETFDDDFLQPDLLKLLESVEAKSQPRAISPLLRCTPEEIEKKRREAKRKLERRKIAMLTGINKLPNKEMIRR